MPRVTIEVPLRANLGTPHTAEALGNANIIRALRQLGEDEVVLTPMIQEAVARVKALDRRADQVKITFAPVITATDQVHADIMMKHHVDRIQSVREEVAQNVADVLGLHYEGRFGKASAWTHTIDMSIEGEGVSTTT